MKRIGVLLLTVSLLLPVCPAAAEEDVYITDAALLPAETASVLAGQAFIMAAEMTDALCILTEDGRGLRYVSVFSHAAGVYTPDCVSAPLPPVDGVKPVIRTGYTTFSICYGETISYSFSRNYFGGWSLVGVGGPDSSYRCARWRLIEITAGPGRAIAGSGTSTFLPQFDPLRFPPSFALAAQALDTGGYALVNNPDPADRLHLRAAPDQTAVSKGKYYNGTPVYVTQDLGDWVKVFAANDEGYMMKRYLAFGADMLKVRAAFPQPVIRETMAGEDITIYMRPDRQSGVAGVLQNSGAGLAEITVIGVIGADWYHVLCGNGLIGYLPVADFAPGSR